VTISVVLAEDNALLRHGLVRLVGADDDLELVGSAADLPGLRALVDEHKPQVVVTDIRMPPTNSDEGISFAADLRTSNPETGVILLSQYAEATYALKLLAEGTARRGYLLKERVADGAELNEAIHRVADGGSVIDPTVTEGLVAAQRRVSRKRHEQGCKNRQELGRSLAMPSKKQIRPHLLFIRIKSATLPSPGFYLYMALIRTRPGSG